MLRWQPVRYVYTREYWILRNLRSSSIWVPRNLSRHMDKQVCIGDAVLVSNIEMTGRSQTLPWWLERNGVKTTEKQNTLAPLIDTYTHVQMLHRRISTKHVHRNNWEYKRIEICILFNKICINIENMMMYCLETKDTAWTITGIHYTRHLPCMLRRCGGRGAWPRGTWLRRRAPAAGACGRGAGGRRAGPRPHSRCAA